MYRYAGNFGEIERSSLSCNTTFAPMTRQSGGLLVVQAPADHKITCALSTFERKSTWLLFQGIKLPKQELPQA